VKERDLERRADRQELERERNGGRTRRKKESVCKREGEEERK
jgi:hypothetical protein